MLGVAARRTRGQRRPTPRPRAATAVLGWASSTIRPRAVPMRAPTSAPTTTRCWPRRRSDRSTGPPRSNTTLTTLPKPAEAKRRELELGLSADQLAATEARCLAGGDVQIGTDHISLNPANEGYRLRRGQVANHAAAGQPPRFEAGVGVSAPPTPRRPRPVGGDAWGAIVISAGRLRPAAFVPAGHHSRPQMEGAGPCPTSGTPTRDNTFSGPDEKPDSAPNGRPRPHQGGDAQGPPRPPPATRLRLDRAGDRVSGDHALDRRRAGRARLAPLMPWTWPVPVGDVEAPGGWVFPTRKPWQLAGGLPCPGARFGSCRTA